jgi:hypothetical protein
MEFSEEYPNKPPGKQYFFRLLNFLNFTLKIIQKCKVTYFDGMNEEYFFLNYSSEISVQNVPPQHLR